MLTLIYKESDSATLPIRWCVDEKTLNKFTTENKIPFVLIKVKYEIYADSVFLFKLNDYAAYVPLRFPGNISITGYLVTATLDSIEAIEKCFISSTFDRQKIYQFTKYRVELYVSPEAKQIITVETHDVSNMINVVVNEKLFGNDLPNWCLNVISKYWYKTKPIDECEQRRRLILFPFIVLPIFIVDFMYSLLVNVVETIILWTFTVYCPLDYILHPMTKSINLLDGYEKYNSLIKTLSKYKLFSSIKLLLLPFLPIVYIIFFISSYITTGDVSISLAVSPLITYATLLPAIAIAGIGNAILHLFKNRNNTKVMFKPTPRSQDLLICPENDGSCLPELRLSDKKFKLLFSELKTKVCKPLRG